MQLRDEIARFTAANAEIVAVGPDSPAAFTRFWQEKRIPFVGIPDPDHTISDRFQQEVVWWRLGRMPALVVVDQNSRVRWAHYGQGMSDIPSNDKLLQVLADL